MTNLAEFISDHNQTILLDGAMGTQLMEFGVEMGGQTNISHPEAVSAVHHRYAETGIDIIITNTLTMNRVFIETHKIGVDVREVNLVGVKIARATTHEGQYVLGDMSSTGKLLQPSGTLSEQDAYKAFREQAAILVEGGVDGLIIETMFDLKEALCALYACKAVTGLPVIVSMTFDTTRNGGRTIMGNSARDCAKALTDAGATVVGTNCGSVDPFQMAEIVSMMRKVTSLPIIAQPNAGRPRMVAGQTVFDMTPPDFVEGVRQCIKAGARLVGGCCGTSPDHIQALADKLKSTPS